MYWLLDYEEQDRIVRNLLKICIREFYETRCSTCTPVKNDGGVGCVKNILNRN